MVELRLMKRDTFTKIMLTIIALLLSVIAIRPLINPSDYAFAQSQRAPSTGSKNAPEISTISWEFKELSMTRGIAPGLGLRSLGDWNLSEDGTDLKNIDYLTRSQQLGAQGWELVSVTPISSYAGENYAGATSEVFFLFKRQKR